MTDHNSRIKVMENTAKKLLPCPFCGCERIRILPRAAGFSVNCEECYAYKVVYSRYLKSVETAWNNRKEVKSQMAFERFTARGRSYAPKVSIWKRGQIGLSQGAVERFGLRNFKYVVMFYDSENKMIGLKFTNDEQEEGAAKMNVKPNGAMFTAKSFLDYYDIEYKETEQYEIRHDKEADLYVFNLREAESEQDKEGEKSVDEP